VKISFWTIGKSSDPSIQPSIDDYSKRINNYYKASWQIFSSPKNAHALSAGELKKKEGELILQALKSDDYLVLLDERGKQFSSVKFASLLEKKATESTKHIIFLIGGAFGVDQQVFDRAQLVWSLSELVFPHQLVRLLLAEQVYRACTIIKGEKYHHI